MADNETDFVDEDGDNEDWIELYNDAGTAVDLTGWSLTDNASDLRKWLFPTGASIPANGYLVIFASGKNRRQFGEELHTNFSLKRGGEYLGLVRDDGTTIEHDYGLEFPPQFGAISYGLDQATSTSTVITTGASGQAGSPTSSSDFSSNYNNWNITKNATFSGSNWQNVTTGIGYDVGSGNAYGTWIGSNLQSIMYNQNASVFLRVPFTVSGAASVSTLTLRMRWDDGFIAYINGVEIAADREPASPAWNSISSTSRTDGLNEDWATFSISPGTLGLVDGINILAIHGLNRSTGSSDMLILPELDITTTGALTANASYHLTPTPGAANGTGTLAVPPYISNPTDQADRPVGGVGSTPILVTAQVDETEDNISQVRLYYRIMFGSETTVTMLDNGTNGDVTANDDIYTASIPTTGLNAGQMIRWRIEAEDTSNRIALSPRYNDPLDSDRYYGTVAVNSAHASSQLPIFETFVEDEVAVNERSGTRTSVYYLGEFYDNVQMDLHGQSTAGASFPKKSYDVDFNKGNRFRWKEGEQRVKDINLLTNWADKSKMRNALAYEFLQRLGAGYHYAFPVRVERNGNFFTISDMVEDGDDRFLERIHLDPNGSLYKMYDKLENANTASKKTRQEEGTGDLAALISGINPNLSRDARRLYAYDNIDIAATVSHLAAIIIAGISDTGHKNYYMYRDTEGDGEWRPLPWDVDLSAGRRWNVNDRYFDDTLFNNKWSANPNRLWELFHNTTEFRLMVLRRIETLRTEVLQPAGTPAANDWYVQRVEELKNQLDPNASNFSIDDADLDYTAWGSWGNNNRVRTAADRIINEWLPAKRSYIFSSSRDINNVPVPSPQAVIPNVTIETIDYLPASGNGLEEYLVIKNRESDPIDLSGWTIEGAIDYTFPPGTVIPAGAGTAGSDYIGLLHVARDANAFRTRSGSVTGGQYRYIQGGYSGQLSARGETVELRNATGSLVDSETYADNSTDAQKYLRVTEIMYNPQTDTSITPDAQDFEYIELRNISTTVTLDLTGIQFIEGVQFNFTGSAVTSLAPGDHVLVVANSAAFTARYGGSLPVAGVFFGTLDNAGETLRLDDAAGEKVLEFSYNNSWHPMTDGNGFSLEVIDESQLWSDWGASSNWRASGTVNGSPGAAYTAPTAVSGILVNEVLAHTDLPDKDSVELYNPTGSSVDISGWYLSDDFFEPKKYQIPANTIINGNGYLVFDSDDFGSTFLFSELGESAYLFSADATDSLTGYYHGWDFNASPNGVSFGRYVDSENNVHFVLQSATSLGSANAAPAVGPIVVAEIHYRPPDLSGNVDNDLDEFIVLQNTSSSSVNLYKTEVGGNNTWRLRNAVDFDFPDNTTLSAGEKILVVGFDPVIETTQLASLRALYNIPVTVRTFGPWSGKLDNSNEQIELKEPGDPETVEPFTVPYYMIDEISYRHDTPWPTAADGLGASLQRRDLSTFGDDPINWRAAYPYQSAAMDTDNDGMADWQERLMGLVVGTDDSAIDADFDGFSNADELLAGTNPFDPQSVMKMHISAGQSDAALSFTAMPDIAYTIQYSTTLNGNWQIWQQVPAGATEEVINLNQSVSGSCFFRIVTPPVFQ
ncbi:MAG: lamin tail domain-containing protein [Verrucomicrobiota bacterium]